VRPAARARAAALSGVLVTLALAACDREHRVARDRPLPESTADSLTLTTLYAGEPAPPAPDEARRREYEDNAFHLNEGKRLYRWYNCNGCHANGGGDSGPALMDSTWRYGSDLEQIHATIVQGRPNGMPSFRARIPDQQVWQIAAYVRSMSGTLSPNAAPSRDDHLSSRPAENRLPPKPPVDGGDSSPVQGTVR
jgi:cytochrome c oxidase cbb3-type subunit 3